MTKWFIIIKISVHKVFIFSIVITKVFGTTRILKTYTIDHYEWFKGYLNNVKILRYVYFYLRY